MLNQIDMALAQLSDIRAQVAAAGDTQAQLQAALAEAQTAKAAAEAEHARFVGLRDQLIAAVTGLTTQLQAMG